MAKSKLPRRPAKANAEIDPAVVAAALKEWGDAYEAEIMAGLPQAVGAMQPDRSQHSHQKQCER